MHVFIYHLVELSKLAIDVFFHKLHEIEGVVMICSMKH